MREPFTITEETNKWLDFDDFLKLAKQMKTPSGLKCQVRVKGQKTMETLGPTTYKYPFNKIVVKNAHYSCDELEARFYVPHLRKIELYKDEIQPGDWVKINGANNPWRKIISVDKDDMSFKGFVAWKPDDNMDFQYMAENSIVMITGWSKRHDT